MINEIIEYVKDNRVESGFYAALAVYWSCVLYAVADSILSQRSKNIEDKLTDGERILSGD